MKIVFLLAVALATGLFAPVASAQPARTFVSSFGTDANPCSIAAPCRTLQRGIDAVAASGDVLIVDSGGFGSNVIVTKSVSVFALPGSQSRLFVPAGQSGLVIQTPGIRVYIANLGIAGVDGTGVYFGDGASLSMHNVQINLLGTSVAVSHVAPDGHMLLTGVSARNSNICFEVGPSSPPARATIINSHAINCGSGFRGLQGSIVAIQNSIVSCNSRFNSSGVFSADGLTFMTLDRVTVTQCVFGLSSGPGGRISVSNSTFAANTYAGRSDSNFGIGRTFENNRIFGNAEDALTNFMPIAEQ